MITDPVGFWGTIVVGVLLLVVVGVMEHRRHKRMERFWDAFSNRFIR